MVVPILPARPHPAEAKLEDILQRFDGRYEGAIYPANVLPLFRERETFASPRIQAIDIASLAHDGCSRVDVEVLVTLAHCPGTNMKTRASPTEGGCLWTSGSSSGRSIAVNSQA